MTDDLISFMFTRYYRLSSPIYFDSVVGLDITREEVKATLELHPRAPYDGKVALTRFIQKKIDLKREKELTQTNVSVTV